jgi:hypothetical protein
LKKACEGVACDWSLDRSRIDLSDASAWELPNVHPLVLDVGLNGQPVILAKPMTCGDYVRLGKPVPPYLQYTLEGNAWRLTNPERRFHGREANLLVAPDWRHGEASLVKLADKLQRNRSAGLMPTSRRINLDLTGWC